MATDKAKKGGKSQKKEPKDSEFGDNIRVDDLAPALAVKAGVAGAAALALGVVLGMAEGDGFRRFFHSYLTAFAWVLTIGVGALWWVTLQHLVNAHWSVVLRRIGELFASNALLLAVLALPIVATLLTHNPVLYEWADHDAVHKDHLLHHKAAYLNPTFFAIRFFIYFGFWALLARYFFKSSLSQDSSGKAELVGSMRRTAGPSMIAIALTLTFCAIDFMMSLQARWYSTIFGVYYFASCVLAINSSFVLAANWLQSKGRLTKSVTVEHYHDVGKMMFAFTVFWAYVGFSQFMLIWYANIPEETVWYKERFHEGWGTLSWLLLFGHFVIPFFGLLSRHVKRHRKALIFWACWVLVMIYADMYWLVMPNLNTEDPPFGLMDLANWLGMAALFVAGAAYRAKSVNLLPTKDPRLSKSLSFQNI
jgi:hypothetical protein